MSIEQAEILKRELTDKWVVVTQGVPELRRFETLTGKVKTVNMNCRALVEFDGVEDISWYDIDPQFLSLVDGPRPKAAKTQHAAPAESKKPPLSRSGFREPNRPPVAAHWMRFALVEQQPSQLQVVARWTQSVLVLVEQNQPQVAARWTRSVLVLAEQQPNQSQVAVHWMRSVLRLAERQLRSRLADHH